MRLTDISIRSLPAPDKGQRLYYDEALPSFGCRVSQGGTRSFFVQHGADRQFTTIARYPVVSLADARAEAKRILAERTLGKHRTRSIPWEEARTLFVAACEKKNSTSYRERVRTAARSALRIRQETSLRDHPAGHHPETRSPDRHPVRAEPCARCGKNLFPLGAAPSLHRP